MIFRYEDLLNGMIRKYSWADKEQNRIVFYLPKNEYRARQEFYWVDESRKLHNVEYVDTTQMLELPTIHPGHIESTYIHENRQKLDEIIQRYDLLKYLDVCYPLYVQAERNDVLYKKGLKLWGDFLRACEENEWLEDEYDRYESEYEERIVQNWCQQHGIEYQR